MAETHKRPSSTPEYATDNVKPILLGVGAVGVGVVSGELLVLSQADSDHAYAEAAEVAGIVGLGLTAVMAAGAVATKLIHNHRKK